MEVHARLFGLLHVPANNGSVSGQKQQQSGAGFIVHAAAAERLREAGREQQKAGAPAGARGGSARERQGGIDVGNQPEAKGCW